MKECIRCGDTKPIAEFGKTSAGNPRSWCLECHRAYKAAWKKTAKGRASEARSRVNRKSKIEEWRKENVERVREINRKAGRRYYERNKEKMSAKARRRRIEQPEKWRAVRMVNDALFFGILTKPSRCEACNDLKRKLQGHHDDYWRPLDVRWLCPPCHAQHHVEAA
jgi:hypothetical protein